MMRGIYEVGGKGHSCGIYSFDQDHIHRLAMAAPVSRIMVRQPQSKANAGAFNNGMPMTSSLGCGTWGGNIISENVHLKHYLNTTWVSVPIKEDKPSDEELFGEFYDPALEAEVETIIPNEPPRQETDSWTDEDARRTARRCVRLVGHGDHRHPSGQDRDSRLSDRGADRPRALPRHDLAHAARRSAVAGTVRPSRGGDGARRRSWAARAVDRHRAHGRDVRVAGQRRHGLGDQRPRRHPRRRRSTMHGALSRDRRRSRQGRRSRDGRHGRHRTASGCRREDRSRIRPSVPSDRPADRAAVRVGREGAGRGRRHRALRGDRPRGRSRDLARSRSGTYR